MSRTIIHNATILTLDEDDKFYYPGTIEMENDLISKVYSGNPSEEGLKAASLVIDGTDKLVMPGLVDLHFHTSAAKGYGDNLPLWEYLDEVWYPSIRALTPSSAKTAALYSYITALKSGTTCVNDMYRFLDELADAAAEIGIRAVLSNDVALPEHRLDSIEDNVAAFHKHHNRENGRIKIWLGLEWLPLSSREQLAEIGRIRKELDTGLHIHLCESVTEVQDSAARYSGKTPIEIAYETGCLGPDVVAAHCVHLTSNDITLLSSTGTSISYNAGSNAKLGNGVMPLESALSSGINIGLGIDACECHNSTDMFETMKLSTLMQRGHHRNHTLCPAPQTLRMATINGSRALGFDTGSLRAFKKADVICLDLTKDMMFTPLLRNPLRARKEMLESHLVFGCNGTAVQHVFVDGKHVVNNFSVVAVDEDQVRRDMDRVFEELVALMDRYRVRRKK
ncbi:putative guanine a catabolic enzyme of the guanine salvage pathway [Phaeomoniella chlamydospora]|uniref:Putative guanine a catabolic enzyme of the guanine salvage pathway n=1 Tax=Phaeomoniella chlamydospora TaxID=158046 RepID=A0A0G2GSJ6_PHACM|nr:putative guanine a catabolic enzyme of the guanine salvage pathway [Phaeomoniella chlamydospora]